jgi:hypothetical protein
MIKLPLIALIIAFSLPAAAQVSEPGAESAYPPPEKGDRPDIPGTFALELGINKGLDAPSRFSTGLWGSRTINVYYQYEIRILQSKFSIVPGFGLSLERYKFKNGATLGYDPAPDDSLKLFLPAESGITGLRKSQLVTNYFEVPLELRFNTHPSDPARGFKVGVGGRIGYLYDSFSKLKYKVDGETRQLKDKQNWNLNRFRYGVFGKIGFGNFSFFGYYNLTPLFEEGKGPYEKNIATDFQTMTVGISLSAF